MVRAGGKAMTKMKTIFAVIFLALLIPVLLAAPESEAKAAEIQNRRIDYGIHER